MLADALLDPFIHAFYSQVFTRLLPLIILAAMAGGLFRWALTRLTEATVRKVRQRSTGAEQVLPMPPPRGLSAAGVPCCPACNRSMVERTAKRGDNRGQRFWGCSDYPACKSSRPI